MTLRTRSTFRERPQHLVKIFGPRRFELQTLAGTRMNEGNLRRVEHLARHAKTNDFFKPAVLAGPVSQITCDGVTEKLKVHADLMRPSGVQLGFDQRGRVHSLDHP